MDGKDKAVEVNHNRGMVDLSKSSADNGGEKMPHEKTRKYVLHGVRHGVEFQDGGVNSPR